MSSIYTVSITPCTSNIDENGKICWMPIDCNHKRQLQSNEPFKFPTIHNFTLTNCHAYCSYNPKTRNWAPFDAWKIFRCPIAQIPEFDANQPRGFGHWISENTLKYSKVFNCEVVLMKKSSTPTQQSQKPIFVANPNKPAQNRKSKQNHDSPKTNEPIAVKPHRPAPLPPKADEGKRCSRFRQVPQTPRVWRPSYPGETRPPIPSDEILSQPTRIEYIPPQPRPHPRPRRKFSTHPKTFIPSPVPVPKVEEDDSKFHKSPALVPTVFSDTDEFETVKNKSSSHSPQLSKSPLSQISETIEPESQETGEVVEETQKFETTWEESGNTESDDVENSTM